MKQAFPSIPAEVKERLEKKGFRPYKAEPIPDFLNPHAGTYWLTNAAIVAACLVGRRNAVKHDSIRFFWSSCIVAIPAFALITNVKLDSQDDVGEHRKTLEERLEYSPITRRAWERAIKINDEYQSELRREIADLEKKLAK